MAAIWLVGGSRNRLGAVSSATRSARLLEAAASDRVKHADDLARRLRLTTNEAVHISLILAKELGRGLFGDSAERGAAVDYIETTGVLQAMARFSAHSQGEYPSLSSWVNAVAY